MERKTATPVIDGGIVNAPPNTIATHDFAENLPRTNMGAGAAGSGVDKAGMTTTDQPHLGRGDAVGSGGAGYANEALQDYPKGNEESSSIATGPGVASNNRPTSSKLKESASGVKGLAAAVHGAGEMIRGNINAGVDRAFNDKAGEAYNNVIATAGENEITTGQFGKETKNREGMMPGADGDRRKSRDLLSRHIE